MLGTGNWICKMNEKSRQIDTNRPVQIVGPYFKLNGKGLHMDLKTETLTLLSDVTATIDTERLNP